MKDIISGVALGLSIAAFTIVLILLYRRQETSMQTMTSFTRDSHGRITEMLQVPVNLSPAKG